MRLVSISRGRGVSGNLSDSDRQAAARVRETAFMKMASSRSRRRDGVSATSRHRDAIDATARDLRPQTRCSAQVMISDLEGASALHQPASRTSRDRELVAVMTSKPYYSAKR